MLYLKCTQEVQKAVGLRKENLAVPQPTESPLGNWYVNRFNLGRRKAYIFFSETTLLSFILFQGRRRVTVESLPGMLLTGLEQLLQMKGLPQSAIDKAFENYDAGLYARTDSRADLGSMNDLVLQYQARVEFEGGLEHCDLTSIIMKTNETPQRRLGWQCSWDAVQSRLCRPG
ncbi:DUF6933 domain-containing protein [Quisquiliibacterium transsilvanicum]|jgi:hypothetical protein|uniref:DUF6933 domain-containing protein n=1 Tax=Quisquiliibacterium transsilvanicum TaxID=1549638 RepID=A0A7W8MAL5_9BURK|nr:hypothetical protein [Quisquiliibacterium transsilvanicum]MBB5273807.1 hypothetical protein [Quisquiliibacterium transsilvanicum]